ncbi:MAG TPA: gephyrin-like molybdotransferase Glp [Halanaerobiales bacterium]|nr:gephyrin-like molybdotransferase Glp [Halanaerobiales bacterium]
MSEFLDLNPSHVFWEILKKNIKIKVTSTEIVNFKDSINRVLAEDIYSPENLPPFNRSTVDGFAVRAIDTSGASSSLPTYLEVTGEIEMGNRAEMKINTGEAVRIATGGMLPSGADAVIMIEYTDYLDDSTIETANAVAPGENVVWKGEDIKKGDLLLSEGHLIRPQDAGALAGLGVVEVKVYKKPVVAIISTGDELVSPETVPAPGKIRDINSYSLGAVIENNGGISKYIGIVDDSFIHLKEAVQSSLDSDLILISGGSSVGVKDMTIDVLNSLGEPGVLLHGIAIKPGKPTILALIEGTPVMGLPGHPASSWTITHNLVRPLVIMRSGRGDNFRSDLNFQKKARAVLERNLVSDKGREEYVPVKLILPKKNNRDDLKYIAQPITGKSSLITTLVQADGFIKIETFKEGLNKGDQVDVVVF